MKPERPDLITTDISSGVVYQTFGAVPTSARQEAEAMMSEMSTLVDRGIRSRRVRIKHDHDRSVAERFIAQGNIEFTGSLVRAQTAGATAEEALGRLAERLESKITRLGERRRQAKRRPPSSPPKTWQLGDGSGRPGYTERPPEQRSIVRRKTYSADDRMSLGDALLALDQRDYDFFIFTDSEDERATVVYETGEGRAIRKMDGSKPAKESTHPNLYVNQAEAPSITVADAVSRLNMSDMRFIFFRDSDRQAPSVLYRRLDGHYGLLLASTRIV